MDYRPKRTSLASDTARALKNMIKSSALTGTLPGEMRLKQRLRVGRESLRAALKILEREGWIAKSAQGRQRRIQMEPLNLLRSGTQDLPVSFLSPFPIVDRIVLLETEPLQLRLAELRRELRFLAADLPALKHPEAYLERLVIENPSAAWILHFVGERAQKWFEANRLPAFIYGSPYPGVTLPFLGNDWESAAFHAGNLLLAEGHRIFGFLGFEEDVPGAVSLERGLRRALTASGSKPEPRLILMNNDRTPRSVAQSLDFAFSQAIRPTALVFSSSSQLMTCFSWMLNHGIAVPRDVSLLCVPCDSWFYELRPPVCHYENNRQVFSRHMTGRIMELIESGRVTSRSLRVRLEYVPGGTVGPIPAQPDRGWPRLGR